MSARKNSCVQFAFLRGLPKNAVAKLMGVSCHAVCYWITEMGDYEKLMPKPTGDLVSLKLDVAFSS
jgi:hypothetical protein